MDHGVFVVTACDNVNVVAKWLGQTAQAHDGHKVK